MKVTALLWLALSTAMPATAEPHKVIFDTDFVMPPVDDGLALMLALKSPELDILGVTTVAGNESLERATADAGERMAAALEKLAASNAVADIEDPVEWQREIRRERPLPGRD